MTENEARKLEVPIEWNGKANVCTYCGRVPETFYIVTGHDHTDDSIRWCICRDGAQYKSELEQLRQRVQELEKELERERMRLAACSTAALGYFEGCCGEYKSASLDDVLRLREANKKLTAERDALKQQRDELLAALGSGGRHCNDDTPHSNLCEAIIDSKEADLGQGLDPFWKWAFRRGFHEAETSYKVDITTLEQQRDELLAALENCRLLAARHRKEEWAGHVLRFCVEAGANGEVLR